MVNPGQCRSNANSCIEMANDAADPDMRERLFGLALAWLEIAGDMEREDAEHEELLRALARHFRPSACLSDALTLVCWWACWQKGIGYGSCFLAGGRFVALLRAPIRSRVCAP
jgi:hypothetical protein